MNLKIMIEETLDSFKLIDGIALVRKEWKRTLNNALSGRGNLLFSGTFQGMKGEISIDTVSIFLLSYTM